MSARLILCDIDGCISPEKSIPWNMARYHEFVGLVRRANAGNGPVAPLTLCTGRPQPYVEVLMKQLDIRHPAICENGAVIYKLDDNCSLYGPGVTPEKIERLKTVRAMVEYELIPRYSGANIQFGKEAQISVYSERADLLPIVREEIRKYVLREGGPELCINCSHHYVNISLASVDKGQAVAWLLDELRIERSQAVGIGDTVGDLPLAQNVGYFACPGNAHTSILKIADYVSPDTALDGLLDILDQPAFMV